MACGTVGEPATGAPTTGGAARVAPVLPRHDALGPGDHDPNRIARGASPLVTEPGQPLPVVRPAWLGTRELPRRPDGYGAVLPTPDELRDRRLPPPPGGLDDPPVDAPFAARIGPVPPEVVARSTWHDGCPVGLDELAYVTLTFWGFDDRPHTGELLLHRDVAPGVVEVLRAAFEARFPIEQMRVVRRDELDLAPTGDGNNTTAFVCRETRGGTRWSAHAHGLAIDVNPFHNPYQRDDLVLPELASAYLDRTDLRPGMVAPSGPVVAAFDELGWSWGGRWARPIDWMHFSATGH